MKRYYDTQTISVKVEELPLFAALTPEEANDLQGKLTYTHLNKNSVLFRENTVINGIYIVLSGTLKVYKTGAFGKEHIMRLARYGEPLGFRSVMTGELACTTAECLGECNLCYISGEDLMRLFMSNNEFALTMMRLACRELGEANNNILSLSQQTVRERLASVILHLKDGFNVDEENRLRIAMTREDLANIVGTATESVIRLLSELRQEKTIVLQGRYIKLINELRLINISQGKE